MRKTNTLKKAVCRARQNHEGSPPVPKTWDDMIVPANLRETVRGGAFLALEETVTPDASEKIVIFCSQDQKDVMQTVCTSPHLTCHTSCHTLDFNIEISCYLYLSLNVTCYKPYKHHTPCIAYEEGILFLSMTTFKYSS